MTITRFSGEFAFLSNFYDAPVRIEGDEYATSEHAFQAMKTLDPLERKMIRHAKTPAIAKQLGKNVKLRPDWESVKIDIMRKILREKFSDAFLAKALIDTGDVDLIEGNTWGDIYWGVCDGKGKNWLGRLLMDIRSELRRIEEEIPDDWYAIDPIEEMEYRLRKEAERLREVGPLPTGRDC